MFTKNAEQRNVMCMMDKEMRMYMCMSNCALMYRKLPVASADQSNAVWIRCQECEYKCIDQIQCRLHEQENPTWVPVFLLPFEAYLTGNPNLQLNIEYNWIEKNKTKYKKI